LRGSGGIGPPITDGRLGEMSATFRRDKSNNIDMTDSKISLYGFYGIKTFNGLTILGVPSSNPIKITIALEELGLEYSYIALDVKLQVDRIERLER
jgi:hypothetical protein